MVIVHPRVQLEREAIEWMWRERVLGACPLAASDMIYADMLIPYHNEALYRKISISTFQSAVKLHLSSCHVVLFQFAVHVSIIG